MKYQIVVVHGNLAFINSYRLDFLITIQIPRVTMMAAYYNKEVVHSYARHPILLKWTITLIILDVPVLPIGSLLVLEM